MKCVICNTSFFHNSWSSPAEPCDCGAEVDKETSWSMDQDRLYHLKAEWKARAFVDDVINSIHTFPADADMGALRQSAQQLFEAGYTLQDAVLELLSTEEVNPDLPEAVGLERIHAVRAKYFHPDGRLKVKP
jgi:hypothetical protein